MITGKTKSGFVYAIPEKRIHNMELLDALVEVERGSDAGLSDALNLLLGSFLHTYDIPFLAVLVYWLFGKRWGKAREE